MMTELLINDAVMQCLLILDPPAECAAIYLSSHFFLIIMYCVLINILILAKVFSEFVCYVHVEICIHFYFFYFLI